MTVDAQYPPLSEVIAKHRWTRTSTFDVRCTGCDWRGDLRNTGKTSVALIAEHVEQVWLETRVIRTAGQLDALPDGSSVRPRAGLLYAVAEKESGQWWAPGLERPVNPRELLIARLLELPTERCPQ